MEKACYSGEGSEVKWPPAGETLAESWPRGSMLDSSYSTTTRTQAAREGTDSRGDGLFQGKLLDLHCLSMCRYRTPRNNGNYYFSSSGRSTGGRGL